VALLHRSRKSEPFKIAVEGGRDGFVLAWCLDLPGCATLVGPGQDILQRSQLAILEFMAWSHNRAADRLTVSPESLEIVQRVDTGENVRVGEGSSFFTYDAEPPSSREFPLWANAHDLALDELSTLSQTMPPALLADKLDDEGRSILSILQHVAMSESWYSNQLRPGSGRKVSDRPEAAIQDLRDCHTILQQVVCDVAPAMRVRRDTSAVNSGEDWSVRKIMRRSLWHIRYHTWELRRSLSRIWLE
jgi:hypothetical protein